MFTGIIRFFGTVADSKELADRARELIIVSSEPLQLKDGDSVAHNGVCLTVVEPSANSWKVRLMHETLKKTTLGDLANQNVVNLETSLRAGNSFDGHFVQGHVDGIGQLTHSEVRGEDKIFSIQAPSSLMPLIAPKGSISLDGVSLTVVDVSHNTFTVSLMPYTLEHTTLGQLEVGDQINIETDMIAKQVAQYLGQVAHE